MVHRRSSSAPSMYSKCACVCVPPLRPFNNEAWAQPARLPFNYEGTLTTPRFLSIMRKCKTHRTTQRATIRPPKTWVPFSCTSTSCKSSSHVRRRMPCAGECSGFPGRVCLMSFFLYFTINLVHIHFGVLPHVRQHQHCAGDWFGSPCHVNLGSVLMYFNII